MGQTSPHLYPHASLDASLAPPKLGILWGSLDPCPLFLEAPPPKA